MASFANEGFLLLHSTSKCNRMGINASKGIYLNSSHSIISVKQNSLFDSSAKFKMKLFNTIISHTNFVFYFKEIKNPYGTVYP